jgi:hypothetical protein
MYKTKRGEFFKVKKDGVVYMRILAPYSTAGSIAGVTGHGTLVFFDKKIETFPATKEEFISQLR